MAKEGVDFRTIIGIMSDGADYNPRAQFTADQAREALVRWNGRTQKVMALPINDDARTAFELNMKLPENLLPKPGEGLASIMSQFSQFAKSASSLAGGGDALG